MKKIDGLIIFGDGLLCLGSLTSVLSGNASVDNYVVLYFTVSILVGYIVRYIVKAKRKHDAGTA